MERVVVEKIISRSGRVAKLVYGLELEKLMPLSISTRLHEGRG